MVRRKKQCKHTESQAKWRNDVKHGTVP